MDDKSITYNGSKLDYDAYNDTVLAFAQNQEYAYSLVFGDVIVDMNSDGDFIGIEILNASKKFNVSPYELLNPLQSIVTYDITDDEIKMSIEFTFVKRNKPIVRSVSATGLNDMNLAPISATLALA